MSPRKPPKPRGLQASKVQVVVRRDSIIENHYHVDLWVGEQPFTLLDRGLLSEEGAEAVVTAITKVLRGVKVCRSK